MGVVKGIGKFVSRKNELIVRKDMPSLMLLPISRFVLKNNTFQQCINPSALVKIHKSSFVLLFKLGNPELSSRLNQVMFQVVISENMSIDKCYLTV